VSDYGIAPASPNLRPPTCPCVGTTTCEGSDGGHVPHGGGGGDDEDGRKSLVHGDERRVLRHQRPSRHDDDGGGGGHDGASACDDTHGCVLARAHARRWHRFGRRTCVGRTKCYSARVGREHCEVLGPEMGGRDGETASRDNRLRRLHRRRE